jgi:molecular chaperone GrpE
LSLPPAPSSPSPPASSESPAPAATAPEPSAPAATAPEPSAPAAAPESGFVVRDRRFSAVTAEEAAEEAATTPRYPSYVEQLQEELAAARRDAAAREAQLRELAAKVEDEVARGVAAAEARIRRDAERRLKRAEGELATGMIEVLDNLQRSLAAASETESPPGLLEGLRLVEAQFLARLAAHGVERIVAVGTPFDPACHEAVGVVPAAAAEDGQVVQELQSGFRGAEGVVRPARVIVAKRDA